MRKHQLSFIILASLTLASLCLAQSSQSFRQEVCK